MNDTDLIDGRADALSSLVEGLASYSGQPSGLVPYFLQEMCQAAPAESGSLLVSHNQGPQWLPIALFPAPAPNTPAPTWIKDALTNVVPASDSGVTAFIPHDDGKSFYNRTNGKQIVIIPVIMPKDKAAAGVKACFAFLVAQENGAIPASTRTTLEVGVRMFGLVETKTQLAARAGDLERLRSAGRVLAAIQEQSRFVSANMTMCNQVAADWGATRVSLGYLRGRYVYLGGMSHTENINRKMKLARDVESAMEECLDQDVEVVYPAPSSASYVYRSATELSLQHGPTNVCLMPLRVRGEARAVLVVERLVEKPFSVADIESLRLTADMCAPWLLNLHDNDRWFGARAAAQFKKGLKKLVGHEHAWAKFISIGVAAAIVFLCYANGDYNVECNFTVEATVRQMVSAPFNSYIETVNVRPGDPIDTTTVLGTLDASEFRLKLASALADRAGYLKQADQAMRDGKTVDGQIALAQAARSKAQADLLQWQIERSTLTSSVKGVVLTGDLKKELYAPVQQGQTLWEVAPLDSLYAELQVPEDRITEITPGNRGELASASHPGTFIGFTVDRINPVAEVVGQANVFKVRVKFDEKPVGSTVARPDWIRPGMDGVARVKLGRQPYAYIWTRSTINWIRMKLWF